MLQLCLLSSGRLFGLPELLKLLFSEVKQQLPPAPLLKAIFVQRSLFFHNGFWKHRHKSNRRTNEYSSAPARTQNIAQELLGVHGSARLRPISDAGHNLRVVDLLRPTSVPAPLKTPCRWCYSFVFMTRLSARTEHRCLAASEAFFSWSQNPAAASPKDPCAH